MSKQFLTREEASQFLRVTKVTLDNYIKQGTIPAYGIGRRVLLKQEDLINALTKL